MQHHVPMPGPIGQMRLHKVNKSIYYFPQWILVLNSPDAPSYFIYVSAQIHYRYVSANSPLTACVLELVSNAVPCSLFLSSRGLRSVQARTQKESRPTLHPGSTQMATKTAWSWPILTSWWCWARAASARWAPGIYDCLACSYVLVTGAYFSILLHKLVSKATASF